MSTDPEFDEMIGRLAHEYAERWTALTRSIEEATRVMGQYALTLRWARFDAVIGPIIGGVVILGTLLIAAVGAYWSGR